MSKKLLKVLEIRLQEEISKALGNFSSEELDNLFSILPNIFKGKKSIIAERRR